MTAGGGRPGLDRHVVVGLGARPGRAAAELTRAIGAALAEAGLTAADVRVLATLDRRAAEDGVRAVAAAHGWELSGFRAEELGAHDVPSRSERVAAAVGTPSVAEAAALAAGDELILRKRVFPGITVAIARGFSLASPRGGFAG
ncbi:cobalamin biosynthesis protein [Actinoplanes sp. NPDC051513]|uniref:cobalamin biosynthesis protein n=1 Tax=Actinoplanes sp. NPDC051513 TaxID=3363908 RepID=UPI00379FCBDC